MRRKLPDQRPILRIDPGMHTAAIARIGSDEACSLLVTGSHDKTARLWALPEGRQGSPQLLRTLRVPIGEDNEGKVFAVALSPNGKWVAAGGWDVGYFGQGRGFSSVYIFDTVTGRLVKRLGSFGDVIYHLAFSPDGSRLAATLGGGKGMVVWESGRWRFLAEDDNYGGKSSYGAAFDGANRLYTVAQDGQMRRYSADGYLEAKADTQGGKEPYSIAVHPTAAKLAIGFNDTTAVEVYDASTLNRLYPVDTSGITGDDLTKVTWSAKGAQLYAGGHPLSGAVPLVIWEDQGRGRRSKVLLAKDTISQIFPCGDGIAAAAADPAFGLIAASGEKQVWQEGVTADMRDKKRDALTLSFDGKRVRFGLGLGGMQPVLFDLVSFSLSDAPQLAPGLSAPRTSGVAVTDWENSLAPNLNGEPVALKEYELSRSLAIAPDASHFVLGADFTLRAYRANGMELWSRKPADTAWGVNISGDGRVLIAASGDGTIRWYRMSDGQELLALFVHAEDKRYIAWTPKGYYAASPGAEDLIGWHVNRDWNHAPDFFPVSRFRDQFNRPDIVKRVLDDLDEDTAIAEANRLAAPSLRKRSRRSYRPLSRSFLPPKAIPSLPGNSRSLLCSLTFRSPRLRSSRAC